MGAQALRLAAAAAPAKAMDTETRMADSFGNAEV